MCLIFTLKVDLMCQFNLGISTTTTIGTTTASTTTAASSSIINIPPDATWAQHGVVVAGGNGQGQEFNQLYTPHGLYVDEDQTVFIADFDNHRVMEWKYGATSGQVVAGGNGEGNRLNQLDKPTDVIIDKETDGFIICDHGNRRVVRWSRRDQTSGQIIISDVACWGLAMDDDGLLYVSDQEKSEVKRWRIGETNGTVVAGGNGNGEQLDQLSEPTHVFVDRDHSVFVSDFVNHRVMKWVKDAKEGIVVAGGQGRGNSLSQLDGPFALVVDQSSTIYVADFWNDRIMRWPKGATQGSIVVIGNDQIGEANSLGEPVDGLKDYILYDQKILYRGVDGPFGYSILSLEYVLKKNPEV
ncbi:unnamed protein product [Adineta steineri]|uniref:Peptidylamidoglycolate lyase n=1 Tax=Adineta steineri TaxID=433720 RepID=A0A819M3M3_9BILA|nr:unnamed protein product [Adineta steineri]